MMRLHNHLILFLFSFSLIVGSPLAHAGSGNWSWSKQHDNYMPMRHQSPYLEYEKHLQIPQWDHEQWVAEDWLSQKAHPMDLVDGWYKANIIKEQTFEDDRPVMVVGPNFYHLSGYDKRRVAHTIDVIYGVTAQKETGSFYLIDWKTKHEIGVFDKYGLRLH